MNETNDGRRKRKINYMLMLFMDSKEGRIRQMGFGPRLVETSMVITVAVIATLGVICYREMRRIEELTAQNETASGRRSKH